MNIDLSFYSWELIRSYVLSGLVFSIQLTVIATIGGIFFGTLLALMRLSGNKWLEIPAAAYVNTMRSIPLVMVILWFFLLMPAILGKPIGAELSAIITFVAFEAAITLLRERKMDDVITAVYNQCKAQENLPKEQVQNQVKAIYAPFTTEEISAKIAQIITPKEIQAKVEVVYQTLEGLHEACPNHLGDWYFSGNYPTPGGNKVVNRAFMNWMEGKNARAYM